jgi:hypothetical protein
MPRQAATVDREVTISLGWASRLALELMSASRLVLY